MNSLKLIEDLEEVREYFDNKSVALVGPAAYLSGKSLGETINSYDIVCRIGDIYSKSLVGDLGNRTDVFMCCFQHSGGVAEIPYHLSTDDKITENIKYLISVEKNRNIPWCQTRDQGLEKFKKVYSGFTPPIVLVNDGYLDDLITNKIKTPAGKQGMRQMPHTGFMGLCFLLDSFNIREMFLTGFTFYLDAERIGSKYNEDYQNRLISSYHSSSHVDPGLKRNQIGAFTKLMTKDQTHGRGSTDACLNYFRNSILKSYKEIIHLDEYAVNLLELENIIKNDNIILFGDNQIGK